MTIQGAENRHGSRDSRMGQPSELLVESIGSERQPEKLKNLSSWRNKKKNHIQECVSEDMEGTHNRGPR